MVIRCCPGLAQPKLGWRAIIHEAKLSGLQAPNSSWKLMWSCELFGERQKYCKQTPGNAVRSNTVILRLSQLLSKLNELEGLMEPIPGVQCHVTCCICTCHLSRLRTTLSGQVQGPFWASLRPVDICLLGESWWTITCVSSFGRISGVNSQPC